MIDTAPQPTPQLKQLRCWKCGNLLAKVWLQPGCAVEIKCKCHAMNTAGMAVTVERSTG